MEAGVLILEEKRRRDKEKKKSLKFDNERLA